MSAAAAAWHANSFEGIGVAEICKLARVHKGSFFHFFASKDDLLEAVLDDYAQRVGTWLRDGPFRADVPPLERLQRFLRATVASVRGQIAATGCAHGCPIGNLVIELSTRKPRIRAAAARVFDVMRTVFAETLRDAVVEGSLDAETDVESVAMALLGHMQGMGVLSKAYGNGALLARMEDRVLGLIGATSPAAAASGKARKRHG